MAEVKTVFAEMRAQQVLHFGGFATRRANARRKAQMTKKRLEQIAFGELPAGVRDSG